MIHSWHLAAAVTLVCLVTPTGHAVAQQGCTSSEPYCVWHGGSNCVVGRDRNGNSIYGIEYRERCQITTRFMQNGRCISQPGQTYTRQTQCRR